MLLNGIHAPLRPGMIVEMHIDLINPSPDFITHLNNLGFEDDPFEIFHPDVFTAHMTGRTRSDKTHLAKTLNQLLQLGWDIHQRGHREVDFYIELEVVRETMSFEPMNGKLVPCLDNFSFVRTGVCGKATADIHVEFPAGQVPPKVRGYLEEKKFYWVSTPSTPNFGPEEIATLQAGTYHSAVFVYRALCKTALPGCTGIHLEQKFGTLASRDDLPMPEVISIQRRTA
jgi:hypothetical protein